jgi:integrase/recombinase XerC
MTDADPIAAHLDDLRRARYSTATITAREHLLRGLPAPLLEPDRDAIQAWWIGRQTRPDGEPRAASSLSQDSSHTRAFYRWAMMQGLVERNAADWLPKVRQKRPAPAPVPEAALYRAMLDAPDDMRRALALGAMAGLRSAEIAAIVWEDIDPGNGVLWVRTGKGSKGRSVPLSAGLLAQLGDPSTGPIVGRVITPKAVSIAISRYLRSRDIDYTAHKLRARYATRFLAATGDLAAAARAIGHSDLSSIGRYVVASDDTMRRGAEAAGRIG